ncbi:hypothetical protein M8C13_30325 [Crossiella sp. SN42]|uniref:hypothetical protein n=1 Tax=Crossiella sp. SN42 TaxID=2944808 RepID=UPI00207C5A9A|nr:hypothetical protein [Crossiella sp. SN42]MCO1580058.1 hypothetical protein [Crossiella sp. SN42]
MRRTAALAALLAAVAAVPAAAAAPGTKLEFTATRKLITLPAVPLPGIAYAVQSDLANTDGSAAGKLTISCTVVGLTPELHIEAQCLHIYRFQDAAEIHSTARVTRKLASEDKHQQVIVGGTGRFRGAKGEGSIVFDTDKTVKYTLDYDL